MILAQNQKQNLYQHYVDNSSVNVLKDICVSTLYVGSRDDPIINNEQIDLVKRAAMKNERITCVETSLGGHLGWMCFCDDHDKKMWWLSRTIHDYLAFGNKHFIHDEHKDSTLPILN